MVIVAQQMVAANADLENALIEYPDRTWLSVPDQLQRLVAFEILSMIELLDASE
jgi:hypothetical protein